MKVTGSAPNLNLQLKKGNLSATVKTISIGRP
jgi:hypothetical protein